MIIEIAIGVALGLFIFANARGLLALGTVVALFAMLLVLAGIALWALYSGFQAVRSLPPIFEPGTLGSSVLGVGFGIFFNLLYVFAVGAVIRERLRLEPIEAYVLGGAFYVLFLSTVLATPVAFTSYLDTRSLAGPLLLLLLLAAWVLAIQQCVRRARRARQRVASL